MPALAVADETFSLQASITIPGAPLHSFDISWVDSSLHSYLLADRTHAAIDIIDTGAGHAVRQIIPTGANAFAGDTGVSDTSGPNGVLTVTQPGNPNNQNSHGAPMVWAGDGPHGTDCATNAADCSTVKIFDFATGNLVNVVNTGGQARADELCYDPRDHLVMIANDADNPPFVTFISTEGNNKILGKISIPESNGGIEQCQWNPRNGMIYLNIPSTTDDSNGKVYVIDPRHETIVAKHDATDGCQPAGMAIGPAPQILLGCGGPDALVMKDDGTIQSVISGQGGNDEVWFNPGDGHYSLAESNNTPHQLGIVDSGNAAVDQDIPTGVSSHSVAADPVSNQVYVPVRNNGGGSPTLCGNTNGCVAIFGPSNPDDSGAVARNGD
jgi:DNA-binding beta-propeller fold protein YncE